MSSSASQKLMCEKLLYAVGVPYLIAPDTSETSLGFAPLLFRSACGSGVARDMRASCSFVKSKQEEDTSYPGKWWAQPASQAKRWDSALSEDGTSVRNLQCVNCTSVRNLQGGNCTRVRSLQHALHQLHTTYARGEC